MTPDSAQALFLEGDSFLVTLEQAFTVPMGMDILSFDLLIDPGFDLASQFIPDAFEVTLLGFETGLPVVMSWDAAATSFFNIQEDGTPFLGPETIWNGGRVTVDLPEQVAGTQVVLYFDLIGADFDTAGGLRIDNVVLEPDNCPEAANPDQGDADGDGVGDACDCAPGDPAAFAVPAEVSGVSVFIDRETLTWDSATTLAGSSTVHDVVRGLHDELPVGTGPSETCLASGLAAATLTDAESPPVGAASWYLVRGRNECGVGTYGRRTNGIERIPQACPESACAPLPGAAADLRVELAGGDLRLSWTQAAAADDHVLYADSGPERDFLRARGTGVDGAVGLTIPLPAGEAYYLLAGRNTCGIGPKR